MLYYFIISPTALSFWSSHLLMPITNVSPTAWSWLTRTCNNSEKAAQLFHFRWSALLNLIYFVYGHTSTNVICVVDISQGWAWGAVLTGRLSSGKVSDKDCRRLNTPLPAVRRPFLSYLHACSTGEACKGSLMSKHFFPTLALCQIKDGYIWWTDSKGQCLPAIWQSGD